MKIDVQGFELEVLRGLIGALRAQRVLYVLLEFWPRGMHQHGLDAHDVLQLLHGHGYTLFDSRALRLGGDASSVPLTAANTFQRPVGLRTNVDWYLHNDARQGQLWLLDRHARCGDGGGASIWTSSDRECTAVYSSTSGF